MRASEVGSLPDTRRYSFTTSKLAVFIACDFRFLAATTAEVDEGRPPRSSEPIATYLAAFTRPEHLHHDWKLDVAVDI